MKKRLSVISSFVVTLFEDYYVLIYCVKIPDLNRAGEIQGGFLVVCKCREWQRWLSRENLPRTISLWELVLIDLFWSDVTIL